VLNSSYFLCTFFKAWLETSCGVARSLCGPQLLSTHHFRQCLSLCSLVNLHIKALLLPSLKPLLLHISPFTSFLWCAMRAVGSPICHQPLSLPDLPPVLHQWEMLSTFWAFRGETHILLVTLRMRNYPLKRAEIFHIVISFHGGGRT